ncbi:MAG: BREX system P-loop protein BrxC, partial [Firmicutes bacterium]|nr:BREX system P-loop protein BrxC [Bacillota bacterium]
RQQTWANLQTMLQHAKELNEAEELQRQADAVYTERRLLEEADPLRDIYRDIARLLRTAIRDAYSSLEKAYNQAVIDLEANEIWQRISRADKQSILEAEGIASLPTLDIEDDEALIRTLQETPLQHWKLRTAALVQQFNNAIIRAAKLLQPETQKIRLPSITLATEADVITWVDEIQKKLLEKVKNGPIVIS